MDIIILGIAGVYFLSHLFAAVFTRTRIPDVLALTGIGLVLGPLTGTVSASDFGMVGEVLSSIALVVILFEGGISIAMRSVGRILGQAAVLTVLTFIATTLVTALVVMQVFNFSLYSALLTGVILGGVSPAVVIPLAKGLGLKGRTFALLSIECAISDVLAVVIAFGFIAAYASGHIDPGTIAWDVLASLLVGGMIGVVGGLIWLSVLTYVRNFPNSTLTTIGFLLGLFAVTDLLGFSGAISAFFFGLVLANYRYLQHSSITWLRNLTFEGINRTEHTVFEEFIFILKTFFFVYLGISFTVTDPAPLWAGLTIVAATFVLRLLITRASVPKDMAPRNASYITLMIPKGLAAAVLAGIPAERGVPEGPMMQAVVYSALLGSIAWTAVWIPLINNTPIGGWFDWAMRAGPRGSGAAEQEEEETATAPL